MDLSAISRLSRQELCGWHGWVTSDLSPGPRPGELAALHERARTLGIVLLVSSSRAGLFGAETVTQRPQPDLSASTPS